MEVREQILQRLLEVQSQVGQPLITDAEIRRIRELWTFDFGRWADKLHRPKSQERHE
jgi:hypothetical protein